MLINTMKKVLLMVCLVSLGFSQISCHYSCNLCAGSTYSLCANCSESYSLTIIEDPTLI